MLKFKTPTAATLAAVLFGAMLAGPLCHAQVEVIKLEVPSTRTGAPEPTNNVPALGVNNASTVNSVSTNNAVPTPASMTDFYFQLQTLQQEVQSLRGQVEQQSHELKKLKQQRLDDYLDLDRRVSRLSQPSSAIPTSGAQTAIANTAPLVRANAGVASNAGQLANPQDELALYRSGIDAVLKQRDYDTGIQKFNDYLTAYPQGIYAANAKYWLGQVYLQREDLANSARWFKDLIANHPRHQKTPEAQFKLGKVLHLQGDTNNAQQQLNAVVNSGSSAAKLAQDYLNKHF